MTTSLPYADCCIQYKWKRHFFRYAYAPRLQPLCPPRAPAYTQLLEAALSQQTAIKSTARDQKQSWQEQQQGQKKHQKLNFRKIWLSRNQQSGPSASSVHHTGPLPPIAEDARAAAGRESAPTHFTSRSGSARGCGEAQTTAQSTLGTREETLFRGLPVKQLHQFTQL